MRNDSKKTLEEKFKEKTNGNEDIENKSFECIVENSEARNTK